jgi:hypothetical protein
MKCFLAKDNRKGMDHEGYNIRANTWNLQVSTCHNDTAWLSIDNPVGHTKINGINCESPSQKDFTHTIPEDTMYKECHKKPFWARQTWMACPLFQSSMLIILRMGWEPSMHMHFVSPISTCMKAPLKPMVAWDTSQLPRNDYVLHIPR